MQAYYRPQSATQCSCLQTGLSRPTTDLATRCSCLQTEVEQKAYYRSQSATQYSCLQTEVEHAGLLQH